MVRLCFTSDAPELEWLASKAMKPKTKRNETK